MILQSHDFLQKSAVSVLFLSPTHTGSPTASALMLISCISVWSISSSTLHAALGPAGKQGKGQLTKNNRKWVVITTVTWLTLWNSKPEIVSCQGYLNRCDSSNQAGPEIGHISVSHLCLQLQESRRLCASFRQRQRTGRSSLNPLASGATCRMTAMTFTW